jgi:type IV secretory pathway VirB10-like protein
MQDDNNTPSTPQPASGNAQPTLPARRTSQKPINSIRIATYLVIGLAAIGLISNIGRLGSHVITRVPKSAQAAKPSTVAPDTITSFEEQEKEQVKKLQEENAAAAQAVAQATQAAQNLHDQFPSMMPCSPALAGTQGTGPNGMPITCGSDGQWHPSSEASGIPPMSAAQRRALYSRESGAGSSRENAAETAKQRRLAALSSSSVAIDFTTDAGSSTKAMPTSEDSPNAAPAQLNAANGRPAKKDPPQLVEGTDHSDEAKADDAKESKKIKYGWDRYTGKTYRIFEGTVLETVLTNRINGAFAGPINTMLTTDLWSHDHQHLLIPQGTRCLGTVSAVSGSNQQRLFVAFHRCIMPDGYSLDLDKFLGMNQIGETGLRDLVNHHYFQIFGASLAIGAVGGLAQIGNSATGLSYDPSVSIRNGISQQMGQESMQILDRFLNQLPTFIVRERSRVRVYLSGDLEAPAYDAHQVDPAL